MMTENPTQPKRTRSEQSPTEASARSLGNEQQPSARSLGQLDSNGAKSFDPSRKNSRSEQSRINGSKSKGPKTLAGKARCSTNAVKCARYADVNKNWLPIENGALAGESRELAFGLFEAALAQFQPQSAFEIVTIKKLVYHQCMLDRLDRAEAAMFQTHWNEVEPTLKEHFKKVHNQEPSRAVHTAQALSSIALQEEKVLRVHSRLRRDHERAVAAYIRRLKELRKNFPVIEAIEVNPMELTGHYGLVPDLNPKDQNSTDHESFGQESPDQESPEPEVAQTLETETTTAALTPENRPETEPSDNFQNQQLSQSLPEEMPEFTEPEQPPIAA